MVAFTDLFVTFRRQFKKNKIMDQQKTAVSLVHFKMCGGHDAEILKSRVCNASSIGASFKDNYIRHIHPSIPTKTIFP